MIDKDNKITKENECRLCNGDGGWLDGDGPLAEPVQCPVCPQEADSQDQHSSLADSKYMTITKFAWDEKVEQIERLREANKQLEQELDTKEERWKSLVRTRMSIDEKKIDDMKARAIKAEQERDACLQVLEKMAESDDEWYVNSTSMQEFARQFLQARKGGGEHAER